MNATKLSLVDFVNEFMRSLPDPHELEPHNVTLIRACFDEIAQWIHDHEYVAANLRAIRALVKKDRLERITHTVEDDPWERWREEGVHAAADHYTRPIDILPGAIE